MAAENYEFKILHDVVAPNDCFPDKTHEKVANTLFELIKTSDQGVTIGLEGGWGSGKSTVVGLLRKKLADQDDNTLVFLFDAWAHDGDPLRRIFLESLINEIDPNGNDDQLDALQKEISGRKKTVEVKTKKSTSKLGSWLSLSAIFVPLGAAILSALDYSTLSMSFTSKEPHWGFIIAAILTLAPLWILPLWAIWGETDEKGNRRWDVFESDTEESYTQDITEDGERTSIEFERFFKKIMEYSIGEGLKYKRALIVIDNLDRIEPEQTLAIWSILQTFFQHRSNSFTMEVDAWTTKLWFLVPYDREGLSRVWENQKGSNIENTSQDSNHSAETLSKNQRTKPEGLAPSFLEKCFQVIAEVPEPVMSAWVEYCEEVIGTALHGWPKEKIVEVVNTYKRFESRLESSPTPRQIQTFVNRVGMLGMRWHDTMSAEAIALYALVRRNRSDRELRKFLLAEGLPDGYEGNTANDDLKKQLAGMLFGVDKEKGIELLLEPEIRRTLNTGNSEELQTLIEEHGEAFWVVWQAIREASLPKGHVEEHRIAVTKAFCAAVKNHKERAARDINRLISEWRSRENKWELNKYDYSDALDPLLAALLDKDKLNDLLTWLMSVVNKEINNAISLLEEKDFTSNYLSNIYKLIALLRKYSKRFKPQPYKNLDKSKWEKWVANLNLEKIEIDFVLPLSQTILDLANTIDINCSDNESLNLLIHTFPLLPKIKEWGVVADKLILFANHPNHALGINSAYELLYYMFSSCNKEVQAKIESCIKGAQFNANATKESIDSVPALLALCASVHQGKLLSSEAGQNIKNFWTVEFDQEKCKPVFDLLRENGVLEIVWLLATEIENKVAIGFIRANADPKIYCSSLGVLYFAEYSWASEDDLKGILKNSIIHGGLESAKNDLFENPVLYKKCLKLIRKYGSEEVSDIVNSALDNSTASNWKEALSKDLDLFECIGQIGNHEFKEAIQSLLNDELDRGELSPHIWERFSEIYNKLMDKEDVAKSIAIKYFNLSLDLLSDQAFEQLFPCISSFISEIKVNPLMQRIETWLANSQWNRIASLLTTDFKFEGEPMQSLASRVTSLFSDADDEHQAILLNLAKTFKIPLQNIDENNVDLPCETGPS